LQWPIGRATHLPHLLPSCPKPPQFPDTGGTYDAAELARQQGHPDAFELLSTAKAGHFKNVP
jgi:hypothetical protein